MKIKIYFVFALLLFLAVSPFSFAFFSKFIVNNTLVSFTVDVLQSTTTPLSISIDPSYLPLFGTGNGGALYKINRLHFCANYDVDGNCIDQVYDLCPYISLEPNTQTGGTESTEIGFSQGMHDISLSANGEINDDQDSVDNWDIKIHSPCFQGECPSGYDQNAQGIPLDSYLKGKTFHCQVVVESVDPPVLVRNIFGENKVFAFNQKNVIDITAIFTGNGYVDLSGKASNVLFIPGLEASRLYRPSPVGSGEVQLWEPSSNENVEDLYMNQNGTSIDPNIYTRDIIKETNVPVPSGFAGQNIYKSFSEMMDSLVSDSKINRWEYYAYDWRKSVQDILNNGTSYGAEMIKIDALLGVLADTSKNGKVTIIAHSNGGLIAKALLKKLQDDKDSGKNNLIDKVDVLILVAVPEIGTAKAVPALLHGYDSGLLYGWLMDEVHARELGRNMSSAYGLLPSKEYINYVSASPVTFVDSIQSGPTFNMFKSYGSAISTYTEYKDFLFGNEGRTSPLIDQTDLPIKISQNLFDQAEDLHNGIDSWIPPKNMRVIEVAGWGLDTISSFEYYPKYTCNGNSGPQACMAILDQRPRFTVDGDKTVVVPSAQYMSFLGGSEKYWVDFTNYNSLLRVNRDHKDILEVSELNNFISETIMNESVNYDSVFRNSTPIYNGNRFRLSIHSPVALDAYDSLGNHTGKICPTASDFCYIEENIPNSSYLEFGEGKYINLTDAGLQKIKLQGTGTGSFVFNFEIVYPNGTATTSTFIDIPVTTQTQGEVVLVQDGLPQLKLDVTGDGVIDFTIKPSSTFDPISYLQIMKATVGSLDISRDKKESFDKKINKIIKSLQKEKTIKAINAINKFKFDLQKTISKHDVKHPKPKKLAKTDAQTLLDMLDQLLDNLK